MKTNNFELIKIYWDEENTKLFCKYYGNKNFQRKGIYQCFGVGGERSFIDTDHPKKGQHGTQINFK